MTDTLTSQVVVGTTPTRLVAPTANGQQVIISNASSGGGQAAVFVGGSNVTVTTGVEVSAGQKLSQGPFELPPETTLYGIVQSGTARVDVFSVVGD